MNNGTVEINNAENIVKVQPVPMRLSITCKTETPIAPRLHLVMFTEALAVPVLAGKISTIRVLQTYFHD
jgi:hypothetical protein